jgi:squalene-associated FAD-dependent desaturase
MATGRVAVVGAGLAGLSAALELKRLGFTVDLFERSRLLGGKATSFIVDHPEGPREVDNGQHIYLACCTEFIDFVHQSFDCATGESRSLPLYLQDRFDALLLARGRRPARLRASDLPAPWHLLPALLRYHHLSPLARLRVGWAVLQTRRAPRPGESMATWLERHHQDGATRRAFWDPFLVPALNAPLDQASAEAGLFVIATAFLSSAGAARFGYARVPLARIAEAAAAKIDHVHLRTTVVGLEVRPRTSQLSGEKTPALAFHGVHLADGRYVPFDAVVLAVPPPALKRVLGKPEEFRIGGLDEFHTQPIVDVHLWYDVPTLGFDFAAVLDSPVQWIFQKGPGYICCSMSAAGNYVSWPGAELVAFCHRELAAVLPELSRTKLVHGAATRDREATFIPRPGLQRPGPTTACPQVVIAGAWTDTGWPATMESAVRSGRMAARKLAAQFIAREVYTVG